MIAPTSKIFFELVRARSVGAALISKGVPMTKVHIFLTTTERNADRSDSESLSQIMKRAAGKDATEDIGHYFYGIRAASAFHREEARVLTIEGNEDETRDAKQILDPLAKALKLKFWRVGQGASYYIARKPVFANGAMPRVYVDGAGSIGTGSSLGSANLNNTPL
jgi:hypothetical protein